MAVFPNATITIDDTAVAVASGTDLVTVFGAVPLNATDNPKLWANVEDMYDRYGYSESLEYCALHMSLTKKPVLFVPCPIVTAGTVGRFNASGNTGSSVVTCAAGGYGSLIETDGGLGVGIVASMAFDAARDSGLRLLPCEHLFDQNTTRIAVRRGHYLRGFAYRFIELCAPELPEALVRAALAPARDGETESS